MCTGATIALIAAGVSTVGTVITADQQRDALKDQERMKEIQAQQEREQAAIAAEKIRHATRKQQQSARAALAAAGVDVSSGTPLALDESIRSQGDQDAFFTLLTGERQASASLAEGALLGQRASDTVLGGFFDAAGTAIGGYASYRTAKK